MSAGPDFLVLEATFLAGSYGGAEWPPAPFRFLQAIVAGCRSVDVPGLDWLERQSPPFILAAEEPTPVRFDRAIPNNADPRRPKSTPTVRNIVHRRVAEPVRYCYPLRTEDDRAAAKLVIDASTHVHTLGAGEDMCAVRGLVSEQAPESSWTILLWLPSTRRASGVQVESEVLLRVPVAGSLRSLEDRFQAFQVRLNAGNDGYARPVPAPALHRTVAYRPSDNIPRTALCSLRLVQPEDEQAFRRFHTEDAVIVAGMLRHASMRIAANNSPMLNDFSAGYGTESDPSQRMSWVPIPSVGHVHADGLIRRALWMARASDVLALGELAAGIPAAGLPLVDEGTGECIAVALPVDPAEEPVLDHYLAPASDWVSVTPVILPGDFGGGDMRVMAKLLHKAVRESGIDPGLIEGAEFSKSPFIAQAARLRDVKLKDWVAKNLILYHVQLRFRRAVRGPIVLGRGRHFGLGLFCASPQ